MSAPPRIRQAVLAASDLEAVCSRLRAELGLGEPFSDPGVGYFGLRNAVFALGDTFLEVVSPERADAPAARLLERRERDVAGYMVMFHVDDLASARERARAAGVREVFGVSLEDIEEVHLHPADMRGAIVSLSAPSPPESWRWGGPDWERRAADLAVEGVTIAVADPEAVSARWRSVIGELPAVGFVEDPAEPGLTEIEIRGRVPHASMRVLLISWEYPPVIEGGLGRHVRKLSEHLVAEGVEVHVLTRGGGHLPVEEERHGVVVHRVQEPPFPKDVSAFVRWVQAMNDDMRTLGAGLCAELGFDLVHSHDWLVAGAAERLSRRHRLPWLTTVHATEFGRHQGWVDKHPQSHIHAVERRMVRRADRVITCSRYMRTHVCEVFGISPVQVTVVPNAIDPRDLEPVVADLPALRARYAEPRQRLVLLVGRLVYEKGFHLALDALAPVVRRLRDVRFVVAGTGTAEAELKRQARRLGLARHGTFLGWVGDDMLHSLYRVADLCIVPSIYEPFGLVALEAMASGCLCIVADTGGLREVVPGDGTVGVRFRSRDSTALAEVLEEVLGDDDARAQMVAEAREHVLRFDWGAVARSTQELYAELLAKAAAGARR